MFGKLFILLIYFSYHFNSYVVCRISNERRCVDPKCSVPISVGKTLLRYNADDERLLSFPRNVKVTIFSKEAGDNPTLWEAEIDGKRGYVPKALVREDKLLVNPSDIKLILPTEKIKKPIHVNKNITEETKQVLVDINKTPELPTANSKGIFNMFEGVSADSVPPNSPDIKPQTTEKFQVLDGTTIPLYDDDQINESLESTTPFKSDVNETPPVDNGGALKENEALQENLKEESSEKQDQLNLDTVQNTETSNEGYPESVVETSEIVQGASGINKKVNVDEPPNPTSDSVLENIVKTFSSMMSSGSGEIENEVIEKEEEDEYYYEDENGSADNSDGDEIESANNLSGNEIADESFENNKDVNYTDSSTEINTSPSDSKVNDSVKEVSNLSPEKSGNGFESEHISEKSNLSKGTLTEDSTSETVKEGKAIEAEVKENMQAELSKKENIQTQLNSKSNGLDVNVTNEKEDSSSNAFPNDFAHSPIDAISHNVNVVRTEEDNIPKDSTDEKISVRTEEENIPKDSTDEKISVRTKEENIPTDSTDEKSSVKTEEETIPKDSTHEKISDENVVMSSNLSNDIETATASSGEEDLETHIPPTENPQLSSQNMSTVVDTTSTVNLSMNVESIYQKHPSIDDSSDLESNVNDRNIVKPVVEEPEIHLEQTLSSEIDNAQVPYASAKIENVISENPSVSETTQVPDSHVSSESKSPLPLPPNDLKESTDLPTFLSEGFENNNSNTETIIDSNESNLLNIPKDDESHASPANPLPDLIDEILMAEEEIKAKSQQSKERDSYEAEANEDYVIEEAHEDSGGLFSWMNPVFDLFTSQSKLVETSSTSSSDEIVDVTLDPSRIENIPVDGSCPSERHGEGDCESLKDVPVSKDILWDHSLQSTDMLTILDLLHRIPLELTIWLVITAVVVLIFSLGHYYIEAHRRDGPLVAVINKFEREVLVLRQENSSLKDRLQTVLQQLNDWNTSSSENDALIVELRQELDETKVAKQDLEEQVALLEREVESVTENGLEMHRLLEESLSSQDGSQVLLSTVETLREKLERQEEEIAALSQSLSRKNVEVEELEKKLSQSMEVASGLEERVIAITRDREEEALQLKDKHRQLMAQLEEVMETKALDETRISTELSKLRLTIEELQKTVAEKDAELEEVKEVVKQLRSTDSNDKMDALFDVVSVRAQLRSAVGERDDFRERFLEEEGARKLLEGHMKKITQEVAELKNSFETAEKEKIEALTKLQVLSNYFKEKESQLQKELGLQESMWLQKQSDDHSIYEQMRSLREENEKYKLQNESLKKEIVEQESSFKIQIANVEQKSHENWVASRQAERRLKEVQQEAAQLRNRLTMEKHSANYSMEDGKPISESNGDPSSPPPSLMFPPTSSPPFMMYPMPPPGDFVPLPPLMGSPYPSDSRPPPLGRISSPPLDHRFSPPPPLPYPPFEYPSYGHHSPSPPPPIPSHSHHRNVHKPQPREMSREQKEHSMSNYSPEGDSTVRKNKR